MPIRSTMSSLVAYLRQYGQAATDDAFHGVTYWTDNQLEDILDQRVRYGRVRLLVKNLGLTIYGFDLPRHYWLEGGFEVYDANDDAVATVGTLDADRKLITFAAALDEDETYYAQGSYYNMYEALADLWGQKAEQRYQYVEFKAGTNRMYMGQEYQHCLDRQQFYRNKIAKMMNHRNRKSRWVE